MSDSTFPQATAVEIVALLDDTVLSVTHLTPRERGLSRATKGMFGAAAIALALAAGAIVHAGQVTSANREALAAWSQRGASELDFRAERVSPLTDVAGLTGIVGTIAFLVAGLWRASQERKPTSYRVGRSAGLDAACDGVDEVALIAPAAGGWFFQPTPGMTGDIAIGGEPTALVPGLLMPGACVRASVGRAGFVISTVSAPPASEGTGIHVDGRSLAFGGASAMAHAFLVILFFLIPASASGYSSDILDETARMAVIHVKPSEDPKREMSTEAGPTGTEAAVKPAGAPGSEKPAPGETKPKVRRTDGEVRPAPRVDAESARHAGVLGVLRAESQAYASVADTSDFATGLDDADVQGGWHGQYDDGRGGFNRYPGGTGPGGRHEGPIRSGNYVTGPGPGGPGFPGLPTPGMPGHKPKAVIDICCGEVADGADKGVIRRYVHAKKDQLTWCYQRELTVQPELQGTATMAFTIDRNGRVIEARARGLGAPTVERCLEDVVRTIQFPAGGIVNVTSYPFVFHAAGG